MRYEISLSLSLPSIPLLDSPRVALYLYDKSMRRLKTGEASEACSHFFLFLLLFLRLISLSFSVTYTFENIIPRNMDVKVKSMDVLKQNYSTTRIGEFGQHMKRIRFFLYFFLMLRCIRNCHGKGACISFQCDLRYILKKRKIIHLHIHTYIKLFGQVY